MMDWKRCSPPSQLQSCGCGGTVVELSSDGLVRKYRCGDCHTGLGDITIGHEP